MVECVLAVSFLACHIAGNISSFVESSFEGNISGPLVLSFFGPLAPPFLDWVASLFLQPGTTQASSSTHSLQSTLCELQCEYFSHLSLRSRYSELCDSLNYFSFPCNLVMHGRRIVHIPHDANLAYALL